MISLKPRSHATSILPTNIEQRNHVLHKNQVCPYSIVILTKSNSFHLKESSSFDGIKENPSSSDRINYPGIHQSRGDLSGTNVRCLKVCPVDDSNRFLVLVHRFIALKLVIALKPTSMIIAMEALITRAYFS